MMDFSDLIDFIENRMHMSHVYQPLLIKSLAAAGGTATLRQLALSFLVEDESQILFYEDRIRKMPAQVLRKHGVIKQQGDLVSLTTGPLDYQQRSKVRELCERKIQAFLQKRGLDTWANRMIETDPVPPALRYQALLESGGRCALCGATKDQTTLHVDHILPRSRRGKNVLENLQVLCAECNLAKSNRDTLDLRVAETSAAGAQHDPTCPFCSAEVRARAVVENDLAYAVEAAELARPAPASRAHAPAPAIYRPLAVGHLIILPHRHTPDFLAMTAHERRDAENLARYLKGELASQDPAIKAFSLAADCGLISDRHTAHAQLHLIPRRAGDGLGSYLLVG